MSFLIMLGSFTMVDAETYQTASFKVQTALFYKILSLHNGINQGSDIVIYIAAAPEMVAAMQKIVGKKIGKSKVVAVKTGAGIPSSKPSVIYIGASAPLDDILNYAKKNNVLTMAGSAELITKGVTLGVVIFRKKPKILLNIKSSQAEKIKWNPAILKIATHIS